MFPVISLRLMHSGLTLIFSASIGVHRRLERVLGSRSLIGVLIFLVFAMAFVDAFRPAAASRTP